VAAGLASIAMGAGRANAATGRAVVDLITFIEAPWGLNMALFPVQRVILKAYYGVPLDTNPHGFPLDTPVPQTHPNYSPDLVDVDGYYKYRVVITDWRRQNPKVMTEAQYLAKQFAEGRCNIGTVIPGQERREMVLSVGRRSGKTEMSSCIAAYETYRLLSKGDPQTYYGVPPSENIQLISFATDKDQAGILYQKVSGYFRGCFAPETEIVTDQGVKPIGSLVGTNPTILTRDGTWVAAPIRSFGVQPLLRLTLQRQGIEKVIYTTANHRWFARDARKAHRGQGFREFLTTELRPGKHHLQATFGKSYKGRIDPSPFGVAHGFVFGDGCTTAGSRNATVAHLYGEKDANLLPYFSMCPKRRGDVRAEQPDSGRGECSVEVAALPNFFRDIPPITENKAYLLGWAMGYFAADGCSSSSGVEIASVDRKNVEFFRDVCILLGIGTYDIRAEDKVSNITGKSFRLFRLKLMRGTLDESFFILPSHREAFRALGGDDVRRQVLSWTVKSVEPTDRVEEVFCATVEGHGDFVLAGNIATGNCSFFAPYTANNTQTYARFQTPKDIERYGSYQNDPTAKATIKVTFRSSVAKGSRGPGNIVVIFDEMAHFTDNGQSSADAVYSAVVPSTATFSPKDPRDRRKAIGAVEAKIIAISSPLGKQGVFYQLFGDGFRGGAVGDNRLSFQAATWEVNPTIPAEFFESEFVKDSRTFFTEFGAEFSDRTRGWLDGEKDLLACVNPDLKPRTRAPARMPHFAGVDIALVGDATAIAIGHNDEQGRIVVDLVDSIKAGEGDFASYERLDFQEVADWIADHASRFHITEGIFDQWAGIPMEQALQAKGLSQFESVHHTPILTSQMYQNFKDMMFDKRLMLYDWPIPDGASHCEYIAQLLELQAEYKSKYVTIVQAPKVAGKHDDLADALVRMVWKASQHVGKVIAMGGYAPRPGVPQNVQRVAQRAMMQARRKAFQTGSSPDRQVPKKLGFGRNGGGGGRGPGGLGGLGNPWGRR